jgi:hypothetical protein
MNKPTKSSIESKMEQHIREKSLTKPYGSPEILTHMRRTEAMEWVQRYKRKARADGAEQARVWWAGIISAIERKRGLDAATELRRLMNEERSK